MKKLKNKINKAEFDNITFVLFYNTIYLFVKKKKNKKKIGLN